MTNATTYKLVVFVPLEAAVRVRHAMAAAGAGRIGLYEGCFFSTRGHGFFRPMAGAKPAIGQVETDCMVEEERLECLVHEADLPRVLAAMKAAHPYEEVAYDVFKRTDWPSL